MNQKSLHYILERKNCQKTHTNPHKHTNHIIKQN